MTTTELANYIIKYLKDNGFIIQYYKAVKTNSVYLKLDYGVANSIRISDHDGKEHLNYRYNIGKHYHGIGKEETERGLERNFFPFEEVNRMLALIVSERNAKLEKYGRERYIGFIKKNITERQNNKGFWAQSQLV